MSRFAEAVSRSWATCTASSRVGSTTRACGVPIGRCCGFGSPGATELCSSGMPKPSVLPVPVLAWPMMSRPRSATGSVSDWIGNGVVMPFAASASTMSGRTSKSAKVWVWSVAPELCSTAGEADSASSVCGIVSGTVRLSGHGCAPPS